MDSGFSRGDVVSAAVIDGRLARGAAGPLHGVPLAQTEDGINRSRALVEEGKAGQITELARSLQCTHVLFGTVTEYRYKSDLDGSPIVSVTLRLADAAAALRAHIAAAHAAPAVDEEHFRLLTGFNDIFADEQILEVDSPGLTTPVLQRLPWTNLRRPIWPLEENMTWQVPAEVAVR